MSVTTLVPKTALVVVDLQGGVVALPTIHAVEDVVANAAALATAFRHHGLPVVLVTATGGAPGRTEGTRRHGDRPANWAELVPELKRQPEDHVITKRTWGAFTNTDLGEHLRALGVTQLVIAGIATSVGVESTARHAHEHGFHVTLAVDAMTDTDAEAHANSTKRIFPRLGETGTTMEIIELLGASRA